jgi:phosphatidyl-myo-inositol dimannoside synthase
MKGCRQILLLLSGAFGPGGGIETYGRLLCRAASHYAETVDGNITALILNDDPSELDDKYYRSNDAVRAFARSKRRFIVAALRAAMTVKPDLIIVGHVNFAPLGIVISTLCPRAQTWYLTYGIDFWRRLSFFHRGVLSRSSRILAISDYTRRQGAEANGLAHKPIDLLPCAIDPFWPGLGEANIVAERSGKPVLLSVARLAPSEKYKGLGDVIRSLSRVRQAIPDVRYVIVGGGDDRERLADIARAEGVSEIVEFRGRVSPADLFQAYRDADVFVLPSAKEGFGIVYLEAAAFGKPSIAARSGGSPEVVLDRKTGLLVEFGDADGIAAAAIDLLRDPTLLEMLGSRARHRLLEDFTFSSFYRRFTTLVGGHTADQAATANDFLAEPVVGGKPAE